MSGLDLRAQSLDLLLIVQCVFINIEFGLHLVNVGSGQSTGKTVAIILGGAAGVGFLVICLLFTKNLMKKHDGKYDYLWWWIPVYHHLLL